MLPDIILDKLEEAAVYIGVFCVGIILIILMACGEYPERLADNRVLALPALAMMMPGAVIYIFLSEKRRKIFKHPMVCLVLLYVILFALQIFWVSRVCFYTSWDVGLMKFRVEGIVNGGSIASVSADEGYSVYPNNLFLFYACCLMEKTGMLFSMPEPYHLCIYISCLCVNISCFLGNLLIGRLTDSRVVRGYYTVISIVFILFSPWIMIPYSDTYGMFFVMLGMWGLLCLDKKYLKWVVVAFAAVIGYRIKPTCIFPLFVACMIYGTRYIVSLKRRWKELLVLLCSTLGFCCIGMLIFAWIQYTYSFRINPDMRFAYTHYLMMGLNEESNGAYNHDDFLYSYGFPDVKTRNEADKEEYIYRLHDLSKRNELAEFMRKKALINFNDGSFAWAEGNEFFSGYVEHDNILAEWFQETMVPPGVWGNEGKFFYLYKTILQTIWIFILIGILFTGMKAKEKRRDTACLMIVICGLAVFVMLFEARARYLFLYTPIFLILSLCGWESVFYRIRKIYVRKRRSGGAEDGRR